MTMRKSFEDWYEASRMPCESDWFKRDPDEPDEYFHTSTISAWDGWKAAVKHERAACAITCRAQAELLEPHHTAMAVGAHSCEMLILARDEGVE